MTLEQWLTIATKGLSADSVQRVRAEIAQHSADGVVEVATLGDPEAARCAYRKVLLTAKEAKILGNFAGSRNCRAMKWAVAGIALLALLAVAYFVLDGHSDRAWRSAALALIVLLQFIGPLLPIRTPLRWRIWTALKWSGMFAGVLLATVVGDGSMIAFLAALQGPLTMDILWMSIRRKLPVDQWPPHLYF